MLALSLASGFYIAKLIDCLDTVFLVVHPTLQVVASVVPIHLYTVYDWWLVIDVQICMSNRTLDVMQTVDTVEFNAYKSDKQINIIKLAE